MLTFERLRELAAELASLGASRVRFSGGEPTLRRDLPEVIGVFRAQGITSGITTNGTLLEADYARRLCEAGTASVRLSLESAEPEVHDRVVGSPGAWEKLIRGVLYLRNHSGSAPRRSFQTVLTRLNVDDDLPAIVPLAARLGVGSIKFQPVVVSHLDDASLLPSPEQNAQFRGDYLPRMAAMGQQLGVSVRVDGGDPDGPRPDRDATLALYPGTPRLETNGEHSGGYYRTHTCYLPWYHCTIDFRGNVYPCCHMRESEGVIGNINDRALIDVLQSDAASRLRLRLLTPDVPSACNTCTMQVAENQWIDRLLTVRDGPDADKPS